MRAYAHHTHDLVCPGCQDRLTEAHPYMVDWFNCQKLSFPDLHTSWVFRDEASQNAAFDSGASKLRWPDSKHNKMIDSKPYSEAIDIFQLSPTHGAIFDPGYCLKVREASVLGGFKLRWGGDFKEIGDQCHFELDNN